MSLYSQFIKEHFHDPKFSKLSAPQRIKAIAAVWRKHQGSKSKGAPRKRGRGISSNEVAQAASPAPAAVADTGAGLAEDAEMAGSGRKRPRAPRKAPRRKRGGDSAPMALTGGEMAPRSLTGGALNPLGNGSQGAYVSQSGLGIFSGLLGSIGLGMRPGAETMHPMNGEGIFDDVMNGVRSVGSLAPLALPFIL